MWPIVQITGILSVAVSVVCGFIFGPHCSLSVIFAAVLSLVNFWVLWRVVQRMLQNRRAAFFVVLAVLKLGITGLILWWMLHQHFLDAVGILIGIGILPVALFLKGSKIQYA